MIIVMIGLALFISTIINIILGGPNIGYSTQIIKKDMGKYLKENISSKKD